MIDVTVIFVILVVHWIADFFIQTHKQATGKSSNWNDLLDHTNNYSMCWIIPAYFLLGNVVSTLVFVSVTFCVHTIQDYFTSRWVKKLFDKKDFHNGFVVIGIDQVLHYTQLIFTYLMLANKG